MKIRYSLGLKLNTTELSPDPTFQIVKGTGTWIGVDDPLHTSFNTGAVDPVTGLTGLLLTTTNNDPNFRTVNIQSVANIFRKGYKYRCTIFYDYNPLGNTELQFWALEIFVGYQSISKSRVAGDYGFNIMTFDIWCVEDSPITIQAYTYSGDIVNNFQVFFKSFNINEFEWNDPLDFTQNNGDNKLKISNSDLYEGLKIDYLENIEFYDAGNTYIRANNYSNPIDTKIEYYDQSWKELLIGYIYPQDIEYKINFCNVTIRNIISELLLFNKDKQFNPTASITVTDFVTPTLTKDYNVFWYTDFNHPILENIDMHSVNTGLWNDNAYGFNNFYYMKAMIHEYTSCYVSLKSDLFSNGGTYEGLLFTNGQFLSNSFDFPINFSKSLYQYLQDLNYIFNIALVFENVSGVNYININTKTFFRSLSNIDFYKIKNTDWKYKFDNVFSNIEIGYEFEDDTTKPGQTFWVSGNTVSYNNGVKVSTILRNSNLIRDCLLGTIVNNYFWVRYDIALNKSLQFTNNPDSVTYGYNGDITANDAMNNLLPNLLLTYYSYTLNVPQYPAIGTETLKREFKDSFPLTLNQILQYKANPYLLTNYIDSFEDISGYAIEIEFNLTTHLTTITLFAT